MFYTYSQNNSGGSFVNDDKVCHYVIVEADNSKDANDIAEYNGIYFNGCDDDIDCPCCGARWDSAHWETLTISQVRESIKQAQGSTTLWMNEDIPTAYIQHKNEPCEIIG